MGCAIRRCATWVFVGMLGAGVPNVARAQADALSLEIDRGAPAWLSRCLSEPTLNASYLAAREPTASKAPLAVQVGVVSQTAAREATLEIRAANAERSLGARALPVREQDCSAIADAVALVLVLLSRHAAQEPPPSAAGVADTAPPPPPPAAAPAAAPTPPAAAETPPAQQPPEGGVRVEAAAGALMMVGMLPRVAFGLSLDAELVWGAPSLRLRAALLSPQSKAVAEGSVSFSAYELAVDGCLSASVADNPQIGLRICAGLRGGLVHAASEGFTLQNNQPVDPALYLGLGPEARLGLTDWASLQLGTAAAFALFRPRYVLELQDGMQIEVAEPSPVRAEVDLCLVLIF